VRKLKFAESRTEHRWRWSHTNHPWLPLFLCLRAQGEWKAWEVRLHPDETRGEYRQSFRQTSNSRFHRRVFCRTLLAGNSPQAPQTGRWRSDPSTHRWCWCKDDRTEHQVWSTSAAPPPVFSVSAFPPTPALHPRFPSADPPLQFEQTSTLPPLLTTRAKLWRKTEKEEEEEEEDQTTKIERNAPKKSKLNAANACNLSTTECFTKIPARTTNPESAELA